MKMTSRLLRLLLFSVACSVSNAAQAQSPFTVLHEFPGSFGAPQNLTLGTDGNLYSVTSFGEDGNGQGAVFKIDAPTGVVTVLHEFTGPDGTFPRGGLVQGSDGAFYGVTAGGGTGDERIGGDGTIFKIDSAGTFTSLHSFNFSTDGSNPNSDLVQGSDGAFYGTTASGGGRGYGTIFKLTAEGIFSSLHHFDEADGAFPSSLVRGDDGAFYGTTSMGGGRGEGCIFKVDTAGAFTVLHRFNADFGQDGGRPQSGLIQGSDGALYGTTVAGGTNDFGTVYKMDGAGTVTLVHSFNGTDGAAPVAPLVQGRDGAFYGTTSNNRPSHPATVFKVDGAGTFASLHSFTNTDGPVSVLIQGGDGAFYGTTESGGASNFGTAFKVDGAGTFASLHSFTNMDGATPQTGVKQLADGTLYGTTRSGGQGGAGTIFTITGAGAFASVFGFGQPSEGNHPRRKLIQGADGAFYGVTNGDRNTSAGSVFKVDSTGTFTLLRLFTVADGANPTGPLTPDIDGAFYGTTVGGGTVGPHTYGTVFKLDSAGTFTSLHHFTLADGANPRANVVRGTDGALYGTTEGGGAAGFGTIFSVDSAGTFTVLHSFNNTDGSYPGDALLLGGDGAFYGTTAFSAYPTLGTVFKVDAAGTFAALHHFAADGSEGFNPFGLVQGTDGAFYGMTQLGGTAGRGTVYKITSAGTFTLLHTFNGTDGAYPGPAALVQGTDGAFYGTTRGGGPNNAGSVFKIASSGTFTVLHIFTATDGIDPMFGVIQGSDSAFYGATAGTAGGYGTIFKVDSAGAFTVLHTFASTDGAGPEAGLTQGSDGALYGTTVAGGARNGGVVFRLVPD